MTGFIRIGVHEDCTSPRLAPPETSGPGGDRNANPAAWMANDEPKANFDNCYSGDMPSYPIERDDRSLHASAATERERGSTYRSVPSKSDSNHSSWDSSKSPPPAASAEARYSVDSRPAPSERDNSSSFPSGSREREIVSFGFGGNTQSLIVSLGTTRRTDEVVAAFLEMSSNWVWTFSYWTGKRDTQKSPSLDVAGWVRTTLRISHGRDRAATVSQRYLTGSGVLICGTFGRLGSQSQAAPRVQTVVALQHVQSHNFWKRLFVGESTRLTK
jgi:hypothetical protein